ncbi:MAG TPA: transcriptional regulator [Chitinophagaceae bacterium]|nr:transcriptional regulator [Chitinophagaceae bacterium]
MSSPILQLNKAFDNRIRLGIMSALLMNEDVNFNFLKEMLAITDGNLASHLKPLEELKFIEVKKGFIGRKTNTTYKATPLGESAFKEHLNALEAVIRQMSS